MFVWSKRLVAILLGIFALALGIVLSQGSIENMGAFETHMAGWMALNYVGLVIWIFVWMIDQARVRGKNVWLWLVPFVLVPLPTLMLFILFLQRKFK